MTAGTKHLSIARAIAHRYGNTAEARELADILGLVDEHGRIRPDDIADYSLGFAVPKVSKRAAEKHARDLGARPKVSTAPEALRNLPPLPEPVKAVKTKPKPAKKLPARPPARKVGNKGRKLAPCGSYGAYRRHLRYGEQVDEACAEAARRQWRERDAPRERYLAPCGTYTALRRHRRLGETCDACTGAPSVTDEDRARLTERRRQQGIQPRELKPHGTEGAYRRHIKYKTPVCDACRDAHNARNRELAAARNAA